MQSRPELPVRSAKTLMMRVPRVDWAAICAGTKTQLRGVGGGMPAFGNVKLPRPIVIYSFVRFRATAEQRLHVIESVELEPLGAITPEGLAAEGMADLKEFRRYWIERYDGFKPLCVVKVYTLRPWQDGDRERFGDVLLSYLYGPWL